jgi:hypothetical protein
MAALLDIPDGPSPYVWESSAIWVVPGADPLGKPGQPVAGQPAYLWVGGYVVVGPIELTFDPTLPCPLRAQASTYVHGP